MNLFHLSGYSAQSYRSPIRPLPGQKMRVWDNDISHTGNLKHAVDIIVPDPRVNSLDVFAPASGVVLTVVQHHTEYGDSPALQLFRNKIIVRVKGFDNEYYEICHIAAGSCRLREGENINEGDLLAKTGANGWMTDVRHLHFMVYKFQIRGKEIRKQSLKIRWKV